LNILQEHGAKIDYDTMIAKLPQVLLNGRLQKLLQAFTSRRGMNKKVSGLAATLCIL